MNRSRHRRRWVLRWLLVLLATSAVAALPTLTPFVPIEIRSAIMLAFSGVCHQIADRSPHVDGIQLAVCHRCFGIYLALPAATIGYLRLAKWDHFLNRSARYLILIAVTIPAADWFGDVIGIWSNTPISRFLTGAVFGLIAGYFLCRAMVESSPKRPEVVSG